MRPAVIEHAGVRVVREDLFPGGTKARYVPRLFEGADHVVYASPVEGGAQFALATVAKALGKRVTIFSAKRAVIHPRTRQARALGADVGLVTPGYLNVVQARAAAYAKAAGARLAPFGMDMPEAIEAIAEAAAATGERPDEVWCAGGSGVLARALRKAWPAARLCVVEVGRTLAGVDIPGDVSIHPAPMAFGQPARAQPPFPSDWHYDAKAWAICEQKRARDGRAVLFWNVTGPA